MKEQTFLFADLAGFSALTEAHGDEDAADLVGDFCNCVRELLGGYDAEEVKTIGDAIMLRCSDQAQAVELGVRIVEEVGGRPGFPVVRVGMQRCCHRTAGRLVRKRRQPCCPSFGSSWGR